MPFVPTSHGELFYVRTGAQPHAGAGHRAAPVLLIHGAGSSHLLWPAELRRMVGMSVLALDLPGHGRSGGEVCATIDGHAEAVAEFIRAAGLPPAVIVGHSMGGAIALTLALDWAPCVAGVVAIATAARLPISPVLTAALERDFEAALDLIGRTAWAPGADRSLVERGSRALRETGPAVLRADFAACSRFDVTERLGAIGQPCLLVAGQLDRIVPPESTSRMRERIPGSRLVVIEGAGHMLTLERPQAVPQAIRAFLNAE